MSDRQLQSARHQAVRRALRVVGPVMALAGLIFLIVGMTSFFSSFGSFAPPHYFWCCFVGIPLLGVGLMLTKAGYFGDIVRYFAAEATPVASDAFNEMAEGMQPGMRTAARSITAGVVEGLKPCDPPKAE
jgi:hypothetical protein